MNMQMDVNHLKMNSSKTKLSTIASRQWIIKCTTTEINVNGEMVAQCNETKYL